MCVLDERKGGQLEGRWNVGVDLEEGIILNSSE